MKKSYYCSLIDPDHSVVLSVARTTLFASAFYMFLSSCSPMPLENRFSPGLSLDKNIIDLHCHIAGIGEGDSGCHISQKLRNNWRYKKYLQAFGVSEAKLKKHGDSLVIKLLSEKLEQSKYVKGAVILAMDGVIDDNGELDLAETEIYIPNDFVASKTAEFDNLYFGASINPHRPDSIQLLEKVAGQGAVLIKWLPSVQYIDPSDPQLIPFYEKLKELGLPLLTHTGDEHSFTNARNELGDPKKLILPLEIGVTVIAAHVASSGKNEGQDNMTRLLSLFDRYPNLYADISSLTQINKLNKFNTLMKKHDVQDRFVYGTDFPLPATSLVSPWYFAFKIPFAKIITLNKIKNPWDQDVEIKLAMGIKPEVFSRNEIFPGLGLVQKR
jgi:uncharacterized protein